jgi:hypothetical protein
MGNGGFLPHYKQWSRSVLIAPSQQDDNASAMIKISNPIGESSSISFPPSSLVHSAPMLSFRSAFETQLEGGTYFQSRLSRLTAAGADILACFVGLSPSPSTRLPFLFIRTKWQYFTSSSDVPEEHQRDALFLFITVSIIVLSIFISEIWRLGL